MPSKQKTRPYLKGERVVADGKRGVVVGVYLMTGKRRVQFDDGSAMTFFEKDLKRE